MTEAQEASLPHKTLSRRRLLYHAALAAAGTWAVSCSGESSEKSAGGEAPAVHAKKKVLRIWMARYFNKDITAHFFEEAAIAGKKIGFEVQCEAIVGDFQEIVSKLSAAADAGTLPDIFTSSLCTIQFIKSGRLLPIQDVWDKVGQSMG